MIQSGTRSARGTSWFLVALLALPALASAQAIIDPNAPTFDAYASAEVEHDTNVSRLPNAQIAAADHAGDRTLGDTYGIVVAGLKDSYILDQQKFTANIEGRRYEFDHFSDYDHFEYLADGAFNWKLTSLFDGLLEGRIERSAAPFANNQSSSLEVNTDRSVVAKADMNVSPLWRLDAGVQYRVINAPLQFYPDLVDRLTDSHGGITYIGLANLTYGVEFDHTDGSYTHAPDAGPYTQNVAQLNANYKITGLTTMNGAIGYTRRDQNGSQDRVSAVTGDIGYTRQIAAKTFVSAHLTRAVNDYATGGSSEIDTVVSLAALYQATYKISVKASFMYTRSSFDGQAIGYGGQALPGTYTAGRVDHTPGGGLDVIYQVFKQLQLKAFFERSVRSSEYVIYTYNDTQYGLQAVGHFK